MLGCDSWWRALHYLPPLACARKIMYFLKIKGQMQTITSDFGENLPLMCYMGQDIGWQDLQMLQLLQYCSNCSWYAMTDLRRKNKHAIGSMSLEFLWTYMIRLRRHIAQALQRWDRPVHTKSSYFLLHKSSTSHSDGKTWGHETLESRSCWKGLPDAWLSQCSSWISFQVKRHHNNFSLECASQSHVPSTH